MRDPDNSIVALKFGEEIFRIVLAFYDDDRGKVFQWFYAVQWTKVGFDNLKQIVATKDFIYGTEFGGASTIYKFDPATGNTIDSNTTDFTEPFGISVFRDISELVIADRSTDKLIRLNNDLVKIGEVTFTPAAGNPLFLGSSDGEIGSGIWANS